MLSSRWNAQSCCISYFVPPGEALDEARKSYLHCIALDDRSGGDIDVQAQIGLARLELVVGDPASVRSALDRLSGVLRDRPYSNNVEDAIYFLAIQAAFPSTGQNAAAAEGALEYLDYLRDGYAPAAQGTPTASLYPRWDSAEEEETTAVGAAKSWRGEGLYVDGLPAWALQFQIGLLTSRLGNSTRAMETMENAFTSYEAWLPR